jgi:hypothetical protein
MFEVGARSLAPVAAITSLIAASCGVSHQCTVTLIAERE